MSAIHESTIIYIACNCIPRSFLSTDDRLVERVRQFSTVAPLSRFVLVTGRTCDPSIAAILKGLLKQAPCL